MVFDSREAKGLASFFVDPDLDAQKLSIHISEIAPGTRAHPPHTHEGAEAFYVLEGSGVMEVEGVRQALGPNEAVLVDPTKLHGLENTGSTLMRYMVIICRS